MDNVDELEINKFEALAARWWDPNSEFKPLHEINPLRMNYISQKLNLAGKSVVDIGCGGGILAEAMAHHGATVTAIDLADASLAVAKLHQLESGLDIDYRKVSAEQLAAEEQQKHDVITCMEMLEHVPDPEAIIKACHKLLKPGGNVFFSTINRNPKAYMLAIVGAEYVLKMLPRGTHDYAKFIKPSELDELARAEELQLKNIIGLTNNPLTKTYKLGKDVDVNYMTHYLAPSSETPE